MWRYAAMGNARAPRSTIFRPSMAGDLLRPPPRPERRPARGHVHGEELALAGAGSGVYVTRWNAGGPTRALRKRRRVASRTPFVLAARRMLVPSATRSAAACRRTAEARGRPMAFPDFVPLRFALSIPARVLSTMRARSYSATAASMSAAISRRRVGALGVEVDSMGHCDEADTEPAQFVPVPGQVEHRPAETVELPYEHRPCFAGCVRPSSTRRSPGRSALALARRPAAEEVVREPADLSAWRMVATASVDGR